MKRPGWTLMATLAIAIVGVAAASSARVAAGAGQAGAPQAAAAQAGAAQAGAPQAGAAAAAAQAGSATTAAAEGAAAAGTATAEAAPPPASAEHGALTATAKLESADDPKLFGTVTFTQRADSVHLVVDVAGVDKAGPHGLHLHESGKCEHDPAGKHYTSAGGHYNPTGAPHACPESTVHHAGDLGNIEIEANGTGHFERVTSMLSLNGPNTPVGRAIILHTGADDCKTQPTGNSGARLACGVVEAAAAEAH
jgi:superoxide dismutase, Cu-Zn family